MLAAGTLSARRSTDRTPFCCGPTTTLSDHGRAPSSPRLTATPPPRGRRMLRLIFSNVHLLPRCWSSTTRLPFLRPISFRFCPSRPVRLRLSSQSRPASNPFGVVSGAVAVTPWAGACRRYAGIALGGNAGRQRFGGVAGRYRHLAVRRDSHGELGVDQIEAFSAQPS